MVKKEKSEDKKNNKDNKKEESERKEGSEEQDNQGLEEEIEESEGIRFREISAFLQPLSGFEQGEILKSENLERGVSGIRLTRRDIDDEGEEVSYKSVKQGDNDHYQEVKEEAVEYVTLGSGPERNIGTVRHDTGLELGRNPWHRTDVSKGEDSTESMSQKARVGYEVGDHRREGIFESQERKYKIKK